MVQKESMNTRLVLQAYCEDFLLKLSRENIERDIENRPLFQVAKECFWQIEFEKSIWLGQYRPFLAVRELDECTRAFEFIC